LKILITGAGGQLGLALTRRLSAPDSGHDVSAMSRAEFDIASVAACNSILSNLRPDVVLNCAAYTAVDRAETEQDAAFAINARGPENLVKACNEIGAHLVHFSTDYVFDGASIRPYVETDATAPLGVYGASKLAGERTVLQLVASHTVIRLSWVYSNDGANFYKTMLRLAADRPTLRVVADQRGIPNFCGDLADAIAALTSHSKQSLQEKSGLYHLSATGVTSWHAFASAIVERANLSPKPAVEAISTAEFPTPTRRPAFSALDGSRFEATFGWRANDWQRGLDRCLAERG
jgi:dTDP-4-dehydrorhamnose reductase